MTNNCIVWLCTSYGMTQTGFPTSFCDLVVCIYAWVSFPLLVLYLMGEATLRYWVLCLLLSRRYSVARSFRTMCKQLSKRSRTSKLGMDCLICPVCPHCSEVRACRAWGGLEPSPTMCWGDDFLFLCKSGKCSCVELGLHTLLHV